MLLIFGKTGQVASALQELTKSTDREAVFLDRTQADLSKPETLEKIIKHHKPSLVINAAAYTAVDKAEEEQALAYTINGESPTEMASTCAELEIPMIHLSTDYVFKGDGSSPLNEEKPIKPINTYGASKALGEEGIRNILDQHIIIRTAWVYGVHGHNFLKTMLKLADREDIRVVADQYGTPTTAQSIARAILKISDAVLAGKQHFGTYHFTGGGQTTWHSFACEILNQAKQIGLTNAVPKIHPVATAEYPTPAERPSWSVLNCQKIVKDYQVEIEDWEVGVKRILEILSKS